MFGYVNVYKDLLRVCDYNTFRGYYCGLCRELGKKYNAVTRLGLSYDMTFLAILISSLCDDKPKFESKRCLVHPMAKRASVTDDFGIEYAADISVILTYLKLKDNWDDERSVKSFLRVFYLYPYKRAAKKRKDKFSSITACMEDLRVLEAEGCDNPDKVADCFGRLLQDVFDIDGKNRAMAWLGYNIGRYIYVLDALLDLEDDIKKGCYNPFYKMSGDKDALKEQVKYSLLLTLTEVSNAYNLLDIKKNKEILDNIIYVGLRNNLEKI